MDGGGQDMWHLSAESKNGTWWRDECTAPIEACMERVAALDGKLPDFRPTFDGTTFRADGACHVYFLRRAGPGAEASMELGPMRFEYC